MTKHELTYLYPLLVNEGILICDDYTTWDGARKATDEFFAGKESGDFIEDPFGLKYTGDKVYTKIGS